MGNPMPRISAIFAEVAPTYERVNRVLTLGLDGRWRRFAAAGGGRLVLDVCAGTGNMAEELTARLPEAARVVALDFSAPMMAGLATKKNSPGMARLSGSPPGFFPFPKRRSISSRYRSLSATSTAHRKFSARRSKESVAL